MMLFALSRRFALSLLLAAAPLAGAVAQPPVGVPRSSAFDLGVGLAFGRGGGVRDERDGVGAAMVAAWRVRPVPGVGSVVLGGVLGAQAPVDGTDDCLLVAGGRCAPNYPGVYTLGAVGGWEGHAGTRGASLRVLAGPALLRTTEAATGAALLGRVDAATPALWRVALVGWAQAALAPELRGESYRMSLVGLGLRFR